MSTNRRRSEQINIRLSRVARQLLDALVIHHGISQASLFEMLLRKEAREEDIPIPPDGTTPDTTADNQ